MKQKIITTVIAILIGVLILVSSYDKKLDNEASSFYQVYLNGENIGVIDDKDFLYALIDSNQSAIKHEYNIDTVYPPTNLKIIETKSYLAKLDDINEVYKKLEENDNFTIKGYIVNIKNGEESYKLNVLNKEIFYEAAKRFVRAFLAENEYDKYINNNQDEIVDTGRIIESMSFLENITIKEAYINVKEKIYTDAVELSQFLLFGSNPETRSYTIKLGDTIESISEDNKLNVQEFLIANTQYKNENTILRVGDNVNVTLIDPQLTFVYDLYEISDEVVYYDKETKQDATKYRGYSQITTPGENGIDRITEEYTVTNGERKQETNVINRVTLKPTVTQITTIGTKVNITQTNQPQNPVITDGDWGWPTNKGYVIMSYFEWRWGRHHDGIDISGSYSAFWSSPIYAAADGVVTYTYKGCADKSNGLGNTCGGGLGNQVTIDHQNGYYTRYGHMRSNIVVNVGQEVKKGQVIGYMGSSGDSSGTHLHFAVAQGSPTNYFNPLRLYQ